MVASSIFALTKLLYRPDKVVVLADLPESSFALDEARIEAARQGAQKMMAEGVPPEQNRAAQLELRRAELALKVKNKMKARGSILRIVEDENDQ